MADATGAPSVVLMRGERGAIALNVRNASAVPRTVQIQIQLAGTPANALQIYRANWTGNDASNWAAAELELLGDASSARQTTLLPGITQQIWMQIHPDFSAAAGRLVGRISLNFDAGPPTHIPLSVRVLENQLPARPSLHFAGWDYIDGFDYGYAVTQANTPQLLQHLQARYVDTPWAHRDVMNWDNMAADGTLVGTPDVTALRRWIEQWPDARRFRVYLNVADEIAGIAITDDRFAPAVSAWAGAWSAAIRQLGKSDADFDLLLVDEPREASQVRTTALWARAIRQSGAAFRIWTDPYWPQPSMIPHELIDAADTFAINLSWAESSGDAYWKWARHLAARDKTIELYACDGPARRLDPHTYFRLTAWRAFFAGATAVSFWSFSDTGGGSSDNEFAAPGSNYSPLFISASSVRTGKHMEAAVQGIQDAEYLRMLADVAAAHPHDAAGLRAAELLRQAADLVHSSSRSSNAQWRMQGSTLEIEKQLRRIGKFLDALAE
jgi:hypothetical protein